MPIYAFRCPECAAQIDTVRPMAQSGKPEICPGCGATMCRDYAAQGVRCTADSYRREIHSDSLAICEAQRDEHRRRYPGVPLDNECRPVFSNYRQHEDYLNKRGVHKIPSRKQKVLY